MVRSIFVFRQTSKR